MNFVLRILFLSVVLFISFSDLEAQSPFTFIYGDNSFENKSVKGISDSDGNTYILGVKNLFDPNAQGSPIEGYPIVGFTVIKINSSGYKLWELTKELSMPNSSRLPASNILLVGERIYISYTKPMGWKDCGNNIFVEYDNRGLFCVDTAGEFIFDSLYLNPKCSRFEELALIPLGNTILSVTKENDTARFVQTNSNGTILLDSIIQLPFQLSAVQKLTNGIMLFGYIPQQKKIFTTVLGQNFNILFNKEIQTLRYPEILLKTQIDNNNNVLIMNGPEVISISENAQLQWSSMLPYRCNLIEQQNNLYQIYSNIDSNNFPVIVSYMIDKQGNILQYAIIPSSQNMIIKDVIPSASQSIYISDTSCCYTTPGIATKIHVSTNFNTPLSANQTNKSSPTISLNVIDKKIIVFSKLVEKTNFELINMNAELVLSGTIHQGENTINIQNISPGVYTFRTSKFMYKLFLP